MAAAIGWDAALVAAAFVAAAVLLNPIRRWAASRSVIDRPNERSSHTVPTPRGGGVAIAAVSLIGIAIVQKRAAPLAPAHFVAIVVCLVVVSVVSWLDDLYTLPALLRLAVHIGAAVTITTVIGAWTIVPLPVIGAISLGSTGMLLTVLWVAGLTNAYNFMDGIDGIAAALAVIAGAGFAYIGNYVGDRGVVVIACLVAGAALGFLLYNWSPASIFMGDVGSAFLGFTFAVLAMLAARRDARSIVAGFLLVWPFVFDSSFTLIKRLQAGENTFQPHRSHLYQRLVRRGFSHSFVALLYSGLGMIGFCCAIASFSTHTLVTVLPYVIIPLVALALSRFVVRVERARPAVD